jgi:hypothetical protein
MVGWCYRVQLVSAFLRYCHSWKFHVLRLMYFGWYHFHITEVTSSLPAFRRMQCILWFFSHCLRSCCPILWAVPNILVDMSVMAAVLGCVAILFLFGFLHWKLLRPQETFLIYNLRLSCCISACSFVILDDVNITECFVLLPLDARYIHHEMLWSHCFILNNITKTTFPGFIVYSYNDKFI